MVDHNQNTSSDATAVTFSITRFNPLNSIFCQETSSESGLLHTFFNYSQAFNTYRSSTINLIAVTTLLLTSGLDRCWQ